MADSAVITANVTSQPVSVGAAVATEVTATTDTKVVGNVITGGKGDPGAASSGSSHTHTQSTPAATWTITHPLGRKPFSVSVWLADVLVEADVETPDNATVVIAFASPQSGRAELI